MKNTRKNKTLIDAMICVIALVLTFVFKYGIGWSFETIFLIFGIIYLIMGIFLFVSYRVKKDLLYVVSGIVFISLIFIM